MDLLDQVAEPATALLNRVDDVLSRFGAPAGHPVWASLRRVGMLPGAAVAAVVALRPHPLATQAAALHHLAGGYADIAADLPAPAGWQGPAASAYAERVAAFAGQLSAAPDSLAGRLAATAGYAEALAGWLAGSRRALAGTLALTLSSAEAVALSGSATAPRPAGPTQLALAAAEIAWRVLDTVAAAYDRAEALLDAHPEVTGPAGAPGVAGGGGGVGGTLRVDRWPPAGEADSPDRY